MPLPPQTYRPTDYPPKYRPLGYRGHEPAALERPLTIHQGEGSLLHARPLGDGRAEVGGRVVLDEVRAFDVS